MTRTMPNNADGKTPIVCSVLFFKGKEVAVFKVDDDYYGVDNLCPHRKAPLSTGEVVGHVVVCPWHGARFDLRSGKGLKGPHRADIGCYAVTPVNGTFRLQEKS